MASASSFSRDLNQYLDLSLKIAFHYGGTNPRNVGLKFLRKSSFFSLLASLFAAIIRVMRVTKNSEFTVKIVSV